MDTCNEIHMIVKKSIYAVGVWYTVSGTCIIGFIFLTDTITQCSCMCFVEPFVNQFNEHEMAEAWWSLVYLEELFADCVSYVEFGLHDPLMSFPYFFFQHKAEV